MRKNHTTPLLLVALIAAALTGCGGGNSSDSATPMPPENTTGPDLQTSVAAATYPTDSDALAAWNVLQQAREACGFGLLHQDARLDAAAKAHVNYLTLTPTFGLSAHEEIATNPGFTGFMPHDRAVAQGYKGMVGEVIAFRKSGRESMINLLTVPYHGRGSLWGWRSAGLAYGKNLLVVNYGTETQLQRLGAGVVAYYPCEGAAHVDVSWSGEVPDPFPDMGAERGTPIMLLADPGSTLIVTNFAVLRETSGESLSFRTLTRDNDRNKRMRGNEFVAVPLQALVHGESYRVSYTGTLNGAAVQKTFTFKTMPKPRRIINCRSLQTGEVYACYEDTLERV